LNNKKTPWNYNFLGRKEQPLSAHMEGDGPIDLRPKAVQKYVKQQARLFKENRKRAMRAREAVQRRNDELNFQKKMRHIEKRQKQLDDERNRLMNSRVIDG